MPRSVARGRRLIRFRSPIDLLWAIGSRGQLPKDWPRVINFVLAGLRGRSGIGMCNCVEIAIANPEIPASGAGTFP